MPAWMSCVYRSQALAASSTNRNRFVMPVLVLQPHLAEDRALHYPIFDCPLQWIVIDDVPKPPLAFLVQRCAQIYLRRRATPIHAGPEERDARQSLSSFVAVELSCPDRKVRLLVVNVMRLVVEHDARRRHPAQEPEQRWRPHIELCRRRRQKSPNCGASSQPFASGSSGGYSLWIFVTTRSPSPGRHSPGTDSGVTTRSVQSRAQPRWHERIVPEDRPVPEVAQQSFEHNQVRRRRRLVFPNPRSVS